MDFVVFELFREKLVSTFAFCQATRPPFTRTRVENENEMNKKINRVIKRKSLMLELVISVF